MKHLLFLLAVACLLPACLEESRIGPQFTSETLLEELAQDAIVSDYFQAKNAYDAELQIGIVTGAELPDYENLEGMSDPNEIRTAFTESGFLNSAQISTTFHTLSTAARAFDDKITALGERYEPQVLFDGVESYRTALEISLLSYEELVERALVLKPSLLAGGRAGADCLGEFNDKWNYCGSPSFEDPRSCTRPTPSECDKFKRDNCRNSAVARYEICADL
ncbi:MAG: hypothetical protein AAGF87_18190 [Bacteroidota bacterium]